jgi:RsiW-degrading membrane proteinase PrsW (M82 family)
MPTEQLLRHSRDAVADVWTDLRSFQLKWIVPYETVFSRRVLRNATTWIMLLFGFAPLLGFYVATSTFQLMAWLLTYFALAWAVYFYVAVAKRRSSLVIGFAVAIFTAFIGCQIDIWLKTVPPLVWLYSMANEQRGIASLLGNIFGVGLNEEFWKAVPVLIAAFVVRRVAKPLDGLFYGALSGLGFAVREGFKYLGGAVDGGDLLHQTLIRTTTSAFLHATWAGIAGYFIALGVVSAERRGALCILGIAIAAALHGWYDFAVLHVFAVAIAALAYLLLISYIDRSQDMVHHLERLETEAGRGAAAADTVA